MTTSSIPLVRDHHSMGTPDRLPPLRLSTPDSRPVSRRDAVLLGSTSFRGDSVFDAAGRFLGEIAEIVIDVTSGRVAYALLAVGGFLGMNRKLMPIPWSTVTVDRVYQRCILNIGFERLINAPNLDGDLLPRMADTSWATSVHAHFSCKPYWE